MNLTRFESDGIELYINTVTGESFASAKGYSRMSNVEYETVKKRCQRGGHTQAQILTDKGLQWGTLISEQLICEWLPKDNPKMASKLMQLGVRSFLHTLAGYQVTSDAIAQDIPQVEEQKPDVIEIDTLPLNDLKDLAWLLKEYGGEKLKQRVLLQILKMHHPELPGFHLMKIYEEVLVKVVNTSSNPEIPLTPTDLATELHVYNPKSGHPHPQAVNRLLERLGYQYRINGKWIPTEKGEEFADAEMLRRSDKLFWKKELCDDILSTPVQFYLVLALINANVSLPY